MPKKKWDAESVVREIIRLHNSGMTLNVGTVQASRADLFMAGYKLFGSWEKAIRAAGLNYQEVRKLRSKWTRSAIISEIKRLERSGVRLSCKSTNLSHGGLVYAATKKFGGWSRAVEAAGISYRQHCRKWSTIAWLRRMESEEYKTTLENAERHARTRRRKK